MMKKLVASVNIALIMLFGISVFSISPSMTAYAASIEVDRSSVWFDTQSRTLGGGVYYNGEYMDVAYWLTPSGTSGVENIYQKKNGSDWVFLGTRGPTNMQNNFPSQDSAKLFIYVTNAAAQSKGYDHF